MSNFMHSDFRVIFRESNFISLRKLTLIDIKCLFITYDIAILSPHILLSTNFFCFGKYQKVFDDLLKMQLIFELRDMIDCFKRKQRCYFSNKYFLKIMHLCPSMVKAKLLNTMYVYKEFRIFNKYISCF